MSALTKAMMDRQNLKMGRTLGGTMKKVTTVKTTADSLIDAINELNVRERIRLLATIRGISPNALTDEALCDWMEVTGALHLEKAVAKANRRQLEEIARTIFNIETYIGGKSPAELKEAKLKPERDEERWINTRPVQKHEPMPKEFSAEDQFRARGMGIRLD
jgi:hypothetical protein